MQKAGTILIYCYSMFGLRQRDCLVSDGKGGLLKIDTDYACGYEPPHYPVPATMLNAIVANGDWLALACSPHDYV
jgi:hypothetical protein